MIVGTVSQSLSPCIDLRLVDGDGAEQLATAVVDTGYNGYLLLPRGVPEQLDYLSVGIMPATLADGSTTQLSAFSGTIIWDNEEVPVLALEGDGEPLVGVRLLENRRLLIDMRPEGRVEIS